MVYFCIMAKETKSKAQRTREFIVKKAAPLFNKKGYAGTTLSDLLLATELTKGSLYGNFLNKDEIALAAFDHNLEWIKTGLIQTLAEKENQVDKLLAFVRFYNNEYARLDMQGGCPIMNTSIEADDALPLLNQKVKDSLYNWLQAMKTIIDSGKIKGEIKKEIISDDYASLLVSLIEGGILLAKITEDKKHLLVSLNKAEDVIRNEIAASNY